MLKKSLISAALVALSSTSAFADTESFYLGAQGLYFMPSGDAKSAGAKITTKLFDPKEKVVTVGDSVMFPGLQIGYHVSDSLRVGVAGYLGFGDFVSTFKAKSEYADRLAALEDEKKQLNKDKKNGANLDAETLQASLDAFKDAKKNKSGASITIGGQKTLKYTVMGDGSISVIEVTSTGATIAGKPAIPSSFEEACRAVNKAIAIAKKAEQAEKRLDQLEGTGDDKKGEIATLEEERAKFEKDKTGDALQQDGTWVETLSPKGIVFATVDMKVYESDSFSLSAGLRLGTTCWKHAYELRDHISASSADDTLPEKTSINSWTLAGMALANANINLGDVATLTLSAGYAHLGTPSDLEYGKLKNGKAGPAKFSVDESKVKGFVFGVGLGKDF